MKNNLPKYKITIDEEYSEDGQSLGISMIAFTSKPAILTKGMAFSEVEPKNLFFADELKYRICAPVMVPMEIYRCDSNEEYFVQFTEQEIDAIHQKFMSNLTNKNIFNLEHNSENVMPAFVLEAWIVDNPETDKAMHTYGIQVPKGTLMMTTQITDKQVYSDLVNSGQVGYSIEGFLGLKLSEIKNKETKMENKLNLPAGEYTDKDGKCFIVAEDGTVTECAPQQEMACAPKEEQMGTEVDKTAEAQANPGDKTAEEAKVKETELAVGDAPVADAQPADAQGPAENQEAISYTKEEIDAKFDELYKLIGDMQAEDDAEDTQEVVEPQQTQMSVQERFEAFNRFFTNSRVEL